MSDTYRYCQKHGCYYNKNWGCGECAREREELAMNKYASKGLLHPEAKGKLKCEACGKYKKMAFWNFRRLKNDSFKTICIKCEGKRKEFNEMVLTKRLERKILNLITQLDG